MIGAFFLPYTSSTSSTVPFSWPSLFSRCCNRGCGCITLSVHLSHITLCVLLAEYVKKFPIFAVCFSKSISHLTHALPCYNSLCMQTLACVMLAICDCLSNTYLHIYTGTHTHTHMHTHMHIQTHTHMQKHVHILTMCTGA